MLANAIQRCFRWPAAILLTAVLALGYSLWSLQNRFDDAVGKMDQLTSQSREAQEKQDAAYSDLEAELDAREFVHDFFQARFKHKIAALEFRDGQYK